MRYGTRATERGVVVVVWLPRCVLLGRRGDRRANSALGLSCNSSLCLSLGRDGQQNGPGQARDLEKPSHFYL